MTRILAVFLCIVGLPAVALADVAPPDDYVETCTLAIQQVDGTECQLCGVTSDNFDVCTEQFDGTEFSRVCATWGASFYDEIWCRSTGDATQAEIDAERERRVAAATPAAEDDDKGCAASGSDRAGGAALLLALALGLARRRGSRPA